MAIDIAEKLVEEGVPFRQAHEQVGRLVGWKPSQRASRCVRSWRRRPTDSRFADLFDAGRGPRRSAFAGRRRSASGRRQRAGCARRREAARAGVSVVPHGPRVTPCGDSGGAAMRGDANRTVRMTWPNV